MKVVSICQEMGWTYNEYMNQPQWFLDLLEDKLKIDSDNAKKELKKYASR